MSFYLLALQTYYERLQAEAEHHPTPQHWNERSRAVQQCVEPEQAPSDDTARMLQSQPSNSDASSPSNMGLAGKVMIPDRSSLPISVTCSHYAHRLVLLNLNLCQLYHK